jgi:hypothetical protein
MEKLLKLPRYPFTRAMIEYAPDTHGVYGLFEGEAMIYIGKALNDMPSCLSASSTAWAKAAGS